MKELLQQLASILGAGFAAACCLGAGWALAALSAIGAGFLINDYILIPLYVGLLLLSVALIYRHTHGSDRRPLWLAVAGAVVALSGLFISSILIYAGLATIVGASIWGRTSSARAKA